MGELVFVTADEIAQAVSPLAAVEAIEAELRAGLDVAALPPRAAVPISNGEWLIMPAETSTAVGIKALTVAPQNPARGLARIQGLYILYDRDTLAPTAVLEASSLTAIRTPAVSVAAIRPRLRDGMDALVFGNGPQALGHIATLRAVVELGEVTQVTRSNPVADLPSALAKADVIVCCTTAREPLFDSAPVRDDAILIAMGSHEAAARELDSAIMGRAQVVVEDAATALREAGDVVFAVNDGTLDPAALVNMSDTVNGRVPLATDRPVVFKSTGMAWEDLVIAELAVRLGS
ncbi:MAG: ornithine cyclodeaminase family protein [Propionibacteriaceae bacterium]|jgi:ornithine cyclodeaminase|nr:ornithine cyclodeaminase family protein [Propionibacteriaceae bacterium]